MNLIIGGDVVSTDSNELLFANGNLKKIMGEELLNIWNECDYRIFNLEAPLTKSKSKINKSGGHLKNNPQIINGIKLMNPSCVLLANNHIMDYDIYGLNDTINNLDNSNIEWVGVGANTKKCKKYMAISKDIVVYNCCEKEFSFVGDNKAGANYYDSYSISYDLNKLKRDFKYVIVIFHGGKEYYRYPSPELQKRCHYMIQNGADFVTCQHSHCIGCYEKYNDKTIIYGQGNFIFNKRNNDFWNSSLLIKLNIDDEIDVKFIPIVRTEYGTNLAGDNESKKILEEFKIRSQKIMKGEIYNYYDEFSKEKLANYLMDLSSCPNLLRVIYKFNKKIFFKLFSKKRLTDLLNILRCESHRELFINGIEKKLEEYER